VGYASPLPDPRLSYGYYVSPDMMEGRQELTLSQEFPFFGKRGMRRDVVSRDARAATHTAHAAALDVDFEVKTAFYQYVGLTETGRVLDTEADLLRRMRDVAQVRYSSGTSEQQDVLKIELSLSRLADEVTLNRRERDATRARLNELIGRAATDSLPDPEWSTPDAGAIAALAVPDSAYARRPDVAIAREEIARADASKRLAKREYWPDFMLGVTYEFGGKEDEMIPWMSDDWWELMAGIDLPIWIGSRRAMSREADAMRRSADYELQAATLRASREVEETAGRARAAWERYDRFTHTILPQAEAAFESSEAGYRSGRVDFIDYLDSERMLLEMRKEFAMVMADLGMQMAALERAVGAR
jgi:outer membrane protein TolC